MANCRSSNDYGRLYDLYQKRSGARVLQPMPALDEWGSTKQKVQLTQPQPRAETATDRRLRRFVDTVNEATDSVINFMELQGIILRETSVGDSIFQSLDDAATLLANFMTTTYSAENLSGRNTTDPADFITQSIGLLEKARERHVFILDNFMQYVLNQGVNVEENDVLSEQQMMELVFQSVYPYLTNEEFEQFDVKTMASGTSVRARRLLTRTVQPKKLVQQTRAEQREQKKSILTTIKETIQPLTITALQVPLWAFRKLDPVAKITELTQAKMLLIGTSDYAQLINKITDPKKGDDLTVNRASARRFVRQLRRKGQTVSDLKSDRQNEANTFWSFALQRFEKFLAEEAVARVLPGLCAIMVQSGAGLLIGWMNDAFSAQDANLRIRKEIERLKDREDVRRAEFNNFIERTGFHLDSSNMLYYLEMLKGKSIESENRLAVRTTFETAREVIRMLNKRLLDVPSARVDELTHIQLIRSDKILELSSSDRQFYEDNKDLLNNFAARYTGEIIPVSEIVEGVRFPGLLYQDQVDQLPGAEQFLENRVKLLHTTSSVDAVQLDAKQGVDLWEQSQVQATEVMIDAPSVLQEQVLGFEAQQIAAGEVRAAIGDQPVSPEAQAVAANKVIADAFDVATNRMIKNFAEPLPTDEVRRRAAQLNKDAAWHAIGDRLMNGTHNTLLGSMVLSAVASIGKAFTVNTLSALLSALPSLLTQTLQNTLSWIPTMTAAVFRYGIVNHMLRLAIARGVIASTDLLEEWDELMDERARQMGSSIGDTGRKAALSLMKGLRWMSQMSLSAMSYINNNAMVGWAAFAVMMGLHGGSLIYESLTGSVAVAAFQTAIQNSSFVVLAGTQGVLHNLIGRYMQRYIKEQREAVRRASRRGATEETRIAGQNAQLAIWLSPVRWAVYGSAVSIALNLARLLVTSDSALWDVLFRTDLASVPIEGPEDVPLWIRYLEAATTGNADYGQTRYTFIPVIRDVIAEVEGEL